METYMETGYPVSFDTCPVARHKRAEPPVTPRRARMVMHTRSGSKSKSKSKSKPKPKPKPSPKRASKSGTVAPQTVSVSEEANDTQQRRDAFFVAKKDAVLPLLPDKNFVRRLMEGGKHNAAEIHPYESLESQPTGYEYCISGSTQLTIWQSLYSTQAVSARWACVSLVSQKERHRGNSRR